MPSSTRSSQNLSATRWLLPLERSKDEDPIGALIGIVRRYQLGQETASFLIAMVEGYEVLAKNAQAVKVWEVGIRNTLG